MKKEILSAIGIIAGILFGTTLSLSAQEKLSLKQCREMALKYNKEMAAADRQTLPPTEQGFTALPMEVSAFRAVISLFSCPTPLRENWYPAVSPISPG